MKLIIDSGGNISRDEAPQIQCPVLLMLGREDVLNPEILGRELIERISQGRLVMLDGGHPVHREQPAAFRKLAWDHLQTNR
jgi:pimeloyl-ACP methyl ester carboxylesterase